MEYHTNCAECAKPIKKSEVRMYEGLPYCKECNNERIYKLYYPSN